jgi:hypothetical protein
MVVRGVKYYRTIRNNLIQPSGQKSISEGAFISAPHNPLSLRIGLSELPNSFKDLFEALDPIKLRS